MVYNFNPLSPCGERPNLPAPLPVKALFQSTLPVWGETCIKKYVPKYFLFQSTLPVWGETILKFIYIIFFYISIHSPRVGRDFVPRPQFIQANNFNPLSPCGERHYAVELAAKINYFNPLSPCGERLPIQIISIT